MLYEPSALCIHRKRTHLLRKHKMCVCVGGGGGGVCGG